MAAECRRTQLGFVVGDEGDEWKQWRWRRQPRLAGGGRKVGGLLLLFFSGELLLGGFLATSAPVTKLGVDIQRDGK